MHPRLARFRLLTGPVLMATAAAMLLVPAGPASAKPPPGCAAGGVKVMAAASPALVTVTDTRTRGDLQVYVYINGTGLLIDAPGTPVLLDASWCLGAGNKSQTGTGTVGTSGIQTKKGATQAIGYLVLYDVTSRLLDEPPYPAATAACASEPLVGTWDSGSVGFRHWTCTFDVPSDADPSLAVTKLEALRVACQMAPNAVPLVVTSDEATPGRVAAVCDKD